MVPAKTGAVSLSENRLTSQQGSACNYYKFKIKGEPCRRKICRDRIPGLGGTYTCKIEIIQDGFCLVLMIKKQWVTTVTRCP